MNPSPWGHDQGDDFFDPEESTSRESAFQGDFEEAEVRIPSSGAGHTGSEIRTRTVRNAVGSQAWFLFVAFCVSTR